MIKKDVIAKTVVVHWDSEDECFVARSPLFQRVIGVGDTEVEARQVHKELLDDMYEALSQDRVIGYKTGRPAKPGVALNCKVKEDTIETIKRLAAELGISQGEVVDIAAYFFDIKRADKALMPHEVFVQKRLDQIDKKLTRQQKVVAENVGSYRTAVDGRVKTSPTLRKKTTAARGKKQA